MAMSLEEFLRDRREHPSVPEKCPGCGSPMEPDDGVRYRITGDPDQSTSAPDQGESSNGATAFNQSK